MPSSIVGVVPARAHLARADFDPNFVINPDLRILDVMEAFMTHWEGDVCCWPSIKRLCRAMLEKFNRHMCPRTMIRHINSLVRDQWIRRRCRHRYDKDRRRWSFHSSMYHPAERMTQRMVKAAARTAKMLKKALSTFSTHRVTKTATKLLDIYMSALPSLIPRAVVTHQRL